ncbi:MAG TPA: hypothetical protein VK448_03760 [Dissulfurispiraceae bacterium]|nr:hypothetical protein [Dissulfurispiraceae bacterium]
MKAGRLITIFFGMLVVIIGCVGQSDAGVNVNVGVFAPPPAFVVPAPPPVVVVPGTYVYYAPGLDVDILFYHGYWWRPYEGRWYRSRGYNGPWGYVRGERVPRPIIALPPDYRHVPPGHQRIPYGQMKKNWSRWERDKHWDKHERRQEWRDDRGEGYDRGKHHGHDDHGRGHDRGDRGRY